MAPSRCRPQSPTNATALTARIRVTIPSVKLSVPPSPDTATARSAASYTANAPSKADNARVSGAAACRRVTTHRAVQVARSAAAPIAAPQAKLSGVRG